jgi:hypothetical protein
MGEDRMMEVTRVVALLLGAAHAGCVIEFGPGCPTDLVAEPNGRDGSLFFVNGGYVQDGLWKQLTIPKVIPPEAFSVTTGTIEFHEPSCVTGTLGFPLVDENGNLQCEFDVDSRTSSGSCTIPGVRQDLDGVTVEATSMGSNVVLGVQEVPEGIAIQVGCDESLEKLPLENGVRVLLRDADGSVRNEDTIWVTCNSAAGFGIFYDGLVGTNDPGAEPVVHVGDEFYVHYVLTSPDPQRPNLGGQGMVPDPAFEIVAYLYPVSSPAVLHLRALAPADQPLLRAGAIEKAVPVTILP